MDRHHFFKALNVDKACAYTSLLFLKGLGRNLAFIFPVSSLTYLSILLYISLLKESLSPQGVFMFLLEGDMKT